MENVPHRNLDCGKSGIPRSGGVRDGAISPASKGFYTVGGFLLFRFTTSHITYCDAMRCIKKQTAGSML